VWEACRERDEGGGREGWREKRKRKKGWDGHSSGRFSESTCLSSGTQMMDEEEQLSWEEEGRGLRVGLSLK